MTLNDILKKSKLPESFEQNNLNISDGNRTREFQDFFTPDDISLALFKKYKSYLKPKPHINKILEPTVGSGNLIWLILESDFLADITCLDIQEDYLIHLKEIASKKYTTKIINNQLHIQNF